MYIPQNSNTVMVCQKLIEKWGEHKGDVCVYGDATGGQRRTSSTAGSDWDIVQDVLGAHFKDRLKFRVPRANPTERARVNTVNSRIRNAAGELHLFVDVESAPMVSRDFDGVRMIEGGTGEIDKHSDRKLTHLSDAIGYYLFYVFSGAGKMTIAKTFYG